MSTLQMFSLVPLVGMLCIAAVVDWRERRIPNWLNALIALSGLGCSFLPGHLASPTQAILGLLLGFFGSFVLWYLRAIGGGDVKLLAGIGAWLGPWGVVKLFVVEKVVGLVIVLVQATKQRKLSALFRNSAVLTVNLVNIDTIGADAVSETGKSCRSIDRPLPYAVPVLIALLILLALQ